MILRFHASKPSARRSTPRPAVDGCLPAPAAVFVQLADVAHLIYCSRGRLKSNWPDRHASSSSRTQVKCKRSQPSVTTCDRNLLLWLGRFFCPHECYSCTTIVETATYQQRDSKEAVNKHKFTIAMRGVCKVHFRRFSSYRTSVGDEYMQRIVQYRCT